MAHQDRLLAGETVKPLAVGDRIRIKLSGIAGGPTEWEGVVTKIAERPNDERLITAVGAFGQIMQAPESHCKRV